MPKYNVRRKAQLGLDIREGGIAIPIAPNMYYMDGRSHDEGGIGIGPNNKNGLEVEGGEVVKVGNNDIKVFSSVPLLRGVSPAQLVMGGANPNKVFAAQEEFKDKNRINDDGTRYENGGEKIYTPSKFVQRQIQETGKITIGGAPTIGGLRTFGYLRNLASAKQYGNLATNIFRAGKQLIKIGTDKLVKSGKITRNVAQVPRTIYGQFVGVHGQNLPKTASLLTNNEEEKKAGGIYIKPSKRGTFTAAATKHGMGVQEFASKVLANKEDYSSAMVKKANFARNTNRWKKEYGGDDTKTAALKRLKNKFTIAGKYGDGMFGGAGAGSVIIAQPEFITDTITKKYLVPVTQNFNDAFRDARNSGKTEFMFDGKLYNTNLGDNPNNNTAGSNRTSTIIIPIEHKEIRRRKKEFGGSMIYTINGNIKNGLNLRPKAKYGKIDRKNKDEKVGPDGLIYKRAADGEWYTDGTKHIAFKDIENSTRTSRRDIFKASGEDKINWIGDENDKFISTSSTIPDVGRQINLKLPKPKRTYVGGYDEEEKETKKIGSLTYEKNESGKWVPASKQSTTTTRDGGRPKDFGMTRTGVNHPNGSYKYHPLTGEKISEMGIVETSEPSVKGTTKVSSKSSSTVRGRGTKTSTPKAAAKTTTKDTDVKYGTPLKEKKESLYMTGIKNNSITPLRAGMEKIKSPSSTGGGTQPKDGPWIPQYNTITGRDWLGVGTNLAGHIASYFANNSLLKKAPMPTKPVQFQAAKLRTTHNINPELANINEVTQMNLAEVGRNTASSNTSIARKQRIMNEARDARNKLYGQKENIETQLINLDRRNRQDVYNRNIAAYNDWLDKTYVAKSNNLLNKQRNLTNLISGIPMAVNTMLGTIENRKSNNDMIRAIAAANPNVDGRLLGIGDYYTQKLPDGHTAIYNKNHKLVKYV